MGKTKGSKKRSRSTKVSNRKPNAKLLSSIDSETGVVVKSDVVYGPDSLLMRSFNTPKPSPA